MHFSAYFNAEKFYNKYCKDNIENKKILDVGSYDVNGTMKPIFEKGQYVGLDMEKGPNVDVVGVSHDIPFEDNEFDIVISSSCFEHDDMFWMSFKEMCRVLIPGGYMYVQAPSNGPYHGWPGDNWRFYIDSWKALEKWGKKCGFEIELVEHYIDDKTPDPNYQRLWNDSIGIFRKKPLKKVALISSFCDNQEKLDVLKKNIEIVKSHNLDVIVISPFYLQKDIVDLCDYFFVTKDNPVLEWPERAMYQWKIIKGKKGDFKITATYGDYGFAGLLQVKQLSEIGLSLGYEQFYHMIYDLKIDENVIKGFNAYKANSVYPSKRDETIWEVGLHYMIFDKKHLENFASKITKESYLNLKGGDAFVWLHRHKSELNYNIEKTPVEDEIYYYQEHDFFDFSPIDGVKFFIEKNDETQSPIKLLFYDNPEKLDISITIDEKITSFEIQNEDIIDLGFNKQNLKKVVLTYKGTDYDISNIISEIKHNTLNKI